MSKDEHLDDTKEEKIDHAKGKKTTINRKRSADDVKLVISDEDIDTEDVPGDFFDDFFKEDFMAGLDILDDDEWEESKVPHQANELDEKKVTCEEKSLAEKTLMLEKNVSFEEKHSPEKKPSPGKKASPEKKPSPEKKASSEEKPSHVKRIASVVKQQPKLEDNKISTKTNDPGSKPEIEKKNSKGEKDSSSKTKSGKIKSKHKKKLDGDENRKELKKLKKEMEKNKSKHDVKSKISDKLRIVETGLVPPGMEMETDLEEIRMKEKLMAIKKNVSETWSPKRHSSPARQSSPRKRSSLSRPSPVRHLSPVRILSPRRRRSPLRIRRSPIRTYRTTSPHRSPRRSPRKSPRRSRERHIRRRTRSRSRSKSPYKRRSRYSPDHISRDVQEERRKNDKKLSFLEEIVEKLREPSKTIQTHDMPQSHISNQQYMQLMTPMMPVSAPAPVPAPMPTVGPVSIYPTAPVPAPYDPFDQSYFIGNNNQFPSQPMPYELQQTNPILAPVIEVPPVQSIMDESVQQMTPNTKDEINKLFHDKKITLSEFLAITAKPEVHTSSPAVLKEKIKVISRCQDAIQILSNRERNFESKLLLRRHDKSSKKHAMPNKSPVIQVHQFKLPFTEQPAQESVKSTFIANLTSLQERLGLLDDQIVKIENVEDVDFIMDTPAPPPPQISQCDTFPKSTQTDPLQCSECEKRKKIIYKSIGVACGGDVMSFSVSTQVSEEDFQPKLPRNQSLASLTPAQLLARSSNYSPNRHADPYDSFPQTNVNRGIGYSRNSHFPPDHMDFQPPYQSGDGQSFLAGRNDTMNAKGKAERNMHFNNAGRPRGANPMNMDNRFINYY